MQNWKAWIFKENPEILTNVNISLKYKQDKS